jgi:hypothetical protein
MATSEPSWPARSQLAATHTEAQAGTSGPRKRWPDQPQEWLAGEKRFGSDEQPEDQPCHGTRSHSGMERLAGTRLGRPQNFRANCRPVTAGTSPEAHPLYVSSILSFSDEARLILVAPPFLPSR